MATAVESLPETQASPGRSQRPFPITVAMYARMIESGALGKAPVFLWKGLLVTKMTKNPPHNLAVSALNLALVRLLPEGWFVAPEQPVILGGQSMPEPDLMVVRGSVRDYLKRQRCAADVALIIEVSDTSLWEDRGEVLETNAAEAIPVYWIVNIPEHRLEVYTDPTGRGPAPGYRARQDYRPGEPAPVLLDGREVGRVDPADFLP